MDGARGCFKGLELLQAAVRESRWTPVVEAANPSGVEGSSAITAVDFSGIVAIAHRLRDDIVKREVSAKGERGIQWIVKRFPTYCY